MESVIVIGAGAAGLMAACELSKQGTHVTLLEANDHIGGRISTLNNSSFTNPVELGAEFIHGDLPLTMQLLKEAGIKYYETKGRMFHIHKGEFRKENINEDWGTLMEKMNALENDMPLGEFLQTFFSDKKYEELRQSVQQFAEGFDLANLSDASTIALRDEWENEMGKQYRIEGGYGMLINYLAAVCKNNACTIHLNCAVKNITWLKNKVNIVTTLGQYFTCDKVIIAVPLSALQADKENPAYLEFSPSINEYLDAAKEIGFGTVIKIILQFDESFWNDEKKNIGFIFTGEVVPTWWTQLPKDPAILTGWLGGPNAAILKHATDDAILEMSLQSLASAFARPVDAIKNRLTAYKIVNWSTMPYIDGGYNYNTVKSHDAKKLLNQPIENTLLFAGEALHDQGSVGTVEAALASGRQAALKILQR